MKLHIAPVQLIAQNLLPYVADMHLDGAAVMIRADSREKAEELQALIVAATNAWAENAVVQCLSCGRIDYAARSFAVTDLDVG